MAVAAVSGAVAAVVCTSGSGNASTAARGSEPPAKEISARDFARQTFERSIDVDNRWFPLRPGTQFWFVGSARENGKPTPHREIFTVTDLTKVVDGVRTVVIWDRDYVRDELVEAEIAFFAQDDDGNVWHLGQYPEEYEHGKFVGAPAWLAGLKGGKPGIVMKAKPRLGTPSYSEGYAPPPINWVDHARVDKVGTRTCVPVACFDRVLVTREFETGKPDAFQLKYYAAGVGNVRTGWAGAKDEDHEVLVLSKLRHLGAKGLAHARAGALTLERHAYAIKKDVFGRTRHSVRR
jgi:hypothetical protein